MCINVVKFVAYISIRFKTTIARSQNDLNRLNREKRSHIRGFRVGPTKMEIGKVALNLKQVLAELIATTFKQVRNEI